ncbi:MAG: CopG family transcriptional regulator [Limisphaerales bacterium]
MKTLTVRLPDVLVSEIERESRTRRVSKSDVVRERLHQPRRPSDGGGSTGELIGDILQASWRAKVPPGTPRFRSSKKQKLAVIIRAKKLHR